MKHYVHHNTEEKNFKKLKTRFFLRLRNLGFLKYVLTKLFRNVTYSQRNKLLKIESPLPNVCQLLTMQEAERRILQEGEALFALSQEDGVTFAHPASTLNAALTFNAAAQTQTCYMPKSTAGTSIHQGIISTEGLKKAFLQAVRLFHIKNIAMESSHIFYNMNLSSFRIKAKT